MRVPAMRLEARPAGANAHPAQAAAPVAVPLILEAQAVSFTLAVVGVGDSRVAGLLGAALAAVGAAGAVVAALPERHAFVALRVSRPGGPGRAGRLAEALGADGVAAAAAAGVAAVGGLPPRPLLAHRGNGGRRVAGQTQALGAGGAAVDAVAAVAALQPVGAFTTHWAVGRSAGNSAHPRGEQAQQHELVHGGSGLFYRYSRILF